jgi:hypothetical protein
MEEPIDNISSIGIGQISKSQMVDAIHQLNLLIDKLILGIIAAEHSGEREVEPVVNLYLRNLIITSLHTHFFDGQHFFGVSNDFCHTRLGRMMMELTQVYGGKLLFLFPFFSFLSLTHQNHQKTQYFTLTHQI